MKPTTLFVIASQDTASHLQKFMPPEVMVIGAGSALGGRSFLLVLVTRDAWEADRRWVEEELPLKVTLGGQLFHI